MRNFLKTITHPFLKLGLSLFYSKSRKFSYDGIEVIVHPNVFPPHLTWSTKILLNFISTINLKDKSLLELGCGSGIISLYASKKGAMVTASDINKTALEHLEIAKIKNTLNVNCVYSNLFNNLKNQTFNYIIINPPYYPKQPKSIKEQAWFCGEDFEYFTDLFDQLPMYINEHNTTFMILSQDCNLEHIKSIASKNNMSMQCILEKKVIGEKNFIFKITLS